jgi:hypothetical protein
MLQTDYVLNHIDALVRLSYDVKDRAVSAKLREMADEMRIMVSVAAITNLAADLSPKAASPKPPAVNGHAVPAPLKKERTPAKNDIAQDALRFVQAKYAGLINAWACPRFGAP